ncbi:hypothetical protein [Mameliella sp.]
MKAMLSGFVAMILLAVGAWYGLNEMGFSSADKQSGANVRLD